MAAETPIARPARSVRSRKDVPISSKNVRADAASLGGAAAGLWCVAMAGCFLAGVALLPVSRDVRWVVVIVAAVS